MNLTEIIISLIVSIIGGLIVIYIQDNWLRNMRKEKAYIFRNKFFYIQQIDQKLSDNAKQEYNRKLFEQFFLIILGIYFLWAILFFPLVFKAHLLQETVNLSHSNFASFLNWINFPLDSYVFELSIVKWYCLLLAIFLLIPSLYFANKLAFLFINIKNQFYTISEKDLRIYRAYGFIIALALFLAINIYLIFTVSFWSSLLTATIIIAFFLSKAQER